MSDAGPGTGDRYSEPVISSDTRVMGSNAVRGALRAAGWAVTGLITQLSIVYLIQQITGG